MNAPDLTPEIRALIQEIDDLKAARMKATLRGDTQAVTTLERKIADLAVIVRWKRGRP